MVRLSSELEKGSQYIKPLLFVEEKYLTERKEHLLGLRSASIAGRLVVDLSSWGFSTLEKTKAS